MKKENIINRKRLFLLLLLLFVATAAYCQATDSLPWENTLQKVANAFTGTTARIIFVIIIAIGGIGTAYAKGQGSKETFFWILIGGSITFGGSFVVDFLLPKAGG